MNEQLTNQYEKDQQALLEATEMYGPWAALKIFSDPSLSGIERVHLYDATQAAIWDTVSRENEKALNDHLLVIEFMGQAIAAEMLANLSTKSPFHTQPHVVQPESAQKPPRQKVSPSAIPGFLLR